MAASSLFLETSLINHIFRGTSYTAPTVLGIALTQNLPSKNDTGSLSVGQEISNSSTAYARQALNPSTSNWSPGTLDGITGNSGAITFPTATANWGWVSGVAICDSTTYGGGNMLIYGLLQTPKLIGAGDSFKFNISDLLLAIA